MFVAYNMFLCLNTDLLKYQYNKNMLNFIDIYSFIPVSGGVGMVTCALLCPWAYNVVKTALVCLHLYCGLRSIYQWGLETHYLGYSGTFFVSACPKPGSGFATHYVVTLLYSMI
jgi:hypothetical protein